MNIRPFAGVPQQGPKSRASGRSSSRLKWATSAGDLLERHAAKDRGAPGRGPRQRRFWWRPPTKCPRAWRPCPARSGRSLNFERPSGAVSRLVRTSSILGNSTNDGRRRAATVYLTSIQAGFEPWNGSVGSRSTRSPRASTASADRPPPRLARRFPTRTEIAAVVVVDAETTARTAISACAGRYPAGYPTDLTSVYWSNPATPFWRPTPLALYPPNGVSAP